MSTPTHPPLPPARPWALTPRWVRALAVVLPVAVLAVFLVALARLPPPSQSAVGSDISARLGDRRPDVVVLGNSLAGSGFDEDALERFDTHRGIEAVNLAIDGSVPAHWYYVLRQQVFGAGLRPRLVVIWANYASLAMVQPDRDKDLNTLIELAGGADPLLTDRVFGGSRLEFARARFARSRVPLRDGLVDVPVRSAVGLLRGGPPELDLRTRGGRLLDEANAELFNVPGVADDEARGGLLLGRSDTLDSKWQSESVSLVDSLLPDLVELVTRNGARTVVVLSPARASMVRGCADLGFRAVAEQAEPMGFDVVDLTCASVPAAHYTDGLHLSAEGAVEATTLLAEVLATTGLLDEAPSADRIIASVRGMTLERY